MSGKYRWSSAWLGKALACWLALAMLAASGFCQAAESYTFAVVPQFEQRKLFRIWKPLVDELEKRSGLELKLVATLSVPEFEHELLNGSFDFVYANPYHILRESTHQGYIPLVRDAEPLRGILVVRKDSPLRSLADLHGKTLAMPSPNALGASLLLRADLERLHHVKMAPLYVKTHSSVYLHVTNNLADAGGGVEKTLEEQDQAVRDALRILYTSRELPSHPVAAHPRVPKEARDKLRRALMDLAATPAGLALLAEVPMKRPVAAEIGDYTPMRSWGLDAYWVEPK